MKTLFLSLLAGFLSLFNNSVPGQTIPVILTPTLTPTSIVEITPTIVHKPKIQIKPTVVPTKIPTVSDMVNCHISSNCGGETKYIKKTECDNSICCQIGNNWILYSSKQKCIEEQKKNSSGNNVRPTSIPIPTYKPLPTSTPRPTSAPINTNQNSKTKSQCQEEVKAKYEALQSQYGGGSALEAINQNYNGEMNNCNQYP